MRATAGVYDPPVPRTLRVALAALGLAAVVYGAASLTGGWLGTPPWWVETHATGSGR